MGLCVALVVGFGVIFSVGFVVRVVVGVATAVLFGFLVLRLLVGLGVSVAVAVCVVDAVSFSIVLVSSDLQATKERISIMVNRVTSSFFIVLPPKNKKCVPTRDTLKKRISHCCHTIAFYPQGYRQREKTLFIKSIFPRVVNNMQFV